MISTEQYRARIGRFRSNRPNQKGKSKSNSTFKMKPGNQVGKKTCFAIILHFTFLVLWLMDKVMKIVQTTTCNPFSVFILCLQTYILMSHGPTPTSDSNLKVMIFVLRGIFTKNVSPCLKPIGFVLQLWFIYFTGLVACLINIINQPGPYIDALNRIMRKITNKINIFLMLVVSFMMANTIRRILRGKDVDHHYSSSVWKVQVINALLQAYLVIMGKKITAIYSPSSSTFNSSAWRALVSSVRLLACLAILLLIAGIEINPGPGMSSFFVMREGGRFYQKYIDKDKNVHDLIGIFRDDLGFETKSHLFLTDETGKEYSNDDPLQNLLVNKLIINMKDFSEMQEIIMLLDTGEVMKMEVNKDDIVYNLTEKYRAKFNIADDNSLFCLDPDSNEEYSVDVKVSVLPKKVLISTNKREFDPSKRTLSEDAMKLTNIDNDIETETLERQINNGGVDGFVYIIKKATLVHDNRSLTKFVSAKSEKEYYQKQSKVAYTNDMESWEVGGHVSGWGVLTAGVTIGGSTAGGVGKSNTSEASSEKNSEHGDQTYEVVMTNIIFHTMKSFKVDITMTDRAVLEAKEILKAPRNKLEDEVKAFYSKYCDYIYSGKFYAGGLYKIKSSAKSKHATDIDMLEYVASQKLDSHREASFSGNVALIDAGVNYAKKSGSATGESERKTAEFAIRNIKSECHEESFPGGCSNQKELEEKIKDSNMWNIYPDPFADKRSFLELGHVLKVQADRLHDNDLLKVSALMTGN